MATSLLNTYRQNIQQLKLIPSGGGVFEVEVNGILIHSKKATRSFPNENELFSELKKQGFQAA
ncbi:MAG: Rdx family protein [Planctomycetia bacterium]|nr:Rdx family protein [Planctomycetia bacterium]